MARSSRSERGGERFVPWNDCMTDDIDISNLIGQGSTIFGKKKNTIGNPSLHKSSLPSASYGKKAHEQRSAPVLEKRGVNKSSLPVHAPTLNTPGSSARRKKSTDFSSVAEEDVDNTCRRRSSNIIARDTRMVMSSLSPSAVMSTPPPPKFRPPRWTPNNRNSSGSAGGTPRDGATCLPQHPEAEECESDEEGNGGTSRQHRRGDNRGKRTEAITVIMNCFDVIH